MSETNQEDLELPTCKNFCKGTVNHRSIKSRNSANSMYSYNSWYAIIGLNSIMAFLSLNGILSIGGVNTILCIGSVNSMLSIGSVNSFLAIGCNSSFMKNCISEKKKDGSGSRVRGLRGVFESDTTVAGNSFSVGTFDGKDEVLGVAL